MAQMLGKPFSLLLFLPDELIAEILGYLPLIDLVNVRLVSPRLENLIDNSNYSHHLWSNASLANTFVYPSTISIFSRAASYGNIEALIKLSVAYLYSHGVPEGPGRGTLDAYNGHKAAYYLKQAELLIKPRQPFSWVMIRPPFSPVVICCKACVFHCLKEHCKTSNRNELIPNLFFVVGKVTSYFEDVDRQSEAMKWFEEGADNGCTYSAFETWKVSSKHFVDEIQSIRELRTIVSSNRYCIDAQFELCKLYSQGKFGGITKEQAYSYLRQVMWNSPRLLSDSIFTHSSNITQSTIFVLFSWLVEVSELKSFPSKTLHLAINIVQRYLLARKVNCSQLQLLGISALLIASKWTNMIIITVKEACWFSDHTYRYEEIVCMIGELLAALHGDIQKPLVCDYLDILLTFVKADSRTCHLSAYLSESAVMLSEFGGYSTSHLAAACLLLSRILLEQEFPWPSSLVEGVGFTSSELYQCTILLYSKCLFNDTVIVDHRGVQLNGVKDKYSHERFLHIAKDNFMSFADVKARLGGCPDESFVVDGCWDDYSPSTSIDSLTPSPISFDSCFDAKHTTSMEENPSSYQRENSSISAPSLSTSLPYLPSGIEPLHSEETVGFVPLQSSSSNRLCYRQTNTNHHTADKLKLKQKKYFVSPLGDRTNIMCNSGKKIKCSPQHHHND